MPLAAGRTARIYRYTIKDYFTVKDLLNGFCSVVQCRGRSPDLPAREGLIEAGEPFGGVISFAVGRVRRRWVVPLAASRTARVHLIEAEEPFGDVVSFAVNRVRRRLVVPLTIGCTTRTGREACPYTIKELFYGKYLFSGFYNVVQCRGRSPNLPAREGLIEAGEPFGGVISFAVGRMRRRWVVPLTAGCTARIYRYTIKELFYGKDLFNGFCSVVQCRGRSPDLPAREGLIEAEYPFGDVTRRGRNEWF
ncbi:MAG: hypothetical protein ACOX8R_09615 [Bacillota bacterium]